MHFISRKTNPEAGLGVRGWGVVVRGLGDSG